MTGFLADAWRWAAATAGHLAFMLWWVWVLAILATMMSETFLYARWRRRLLAQRDARGWRPVATAVMLGVSSPPSRSRIFREAHNLLAQGVGPAGVMAYLLSAQTLLWWFLLLVVALNGPQPMLGQFVAVAVALVFFTYGITRTPNTLWIEARHTAAKVTAADPPSARSAGTRLVVSLRGQVRSLVGPLLYGLVGIGVVLAWGQSPAYVSLQGTSGPLFQVGNSVAGLAIAVVTGAPLVGHALIAAGLWKAEILTYSGLSAYYLGTLVMPLVVPRYLRLLGARLARYVLGWLVAAIAAGALVATMWWWGLDWLAGAVDARAAFESLTHSTLRPSPVPWFHHWFQ